MIMPREKREIQKEDIMPLDVYTEKRRELRKSIVDYKKNRRVALGPYATCLLYTSPSPRDMRRSRMPSSA